MCGINVIEAQWVWLLAAWFGEDDCGILPALSGVGQR